MSCSPAMGITIWVCNLDVQLMNAVTNTVKHWLHNVNHF